MVKEIPVEDFTAEKWTRLAQTADAKCKWPRRLNPNFYFPEIQKLMGIDMAKAWTNENQDAFLVALFSRNIFTGDEIGLVQSWVSSGADNQAGLDLLRKFQSEAVRRGCVAVYLSSFRTYREASMARLYRRMGFEKHEVGFIKFLQSKGGETT